METEKTECSAQQIKKEQSRFLSFKEALRYLSVSKSFLYKRTSLGEIKHYKPNGKLIYFTQEDLDEWVMQNGIVDCTDEENQIEDYLMKGGSHGK